MKVSNLEEIRKWVYAQIEQWAQDNFESAESWGQCQDDHRKAEEERKRFVKAKKKEFDELLKNSV
jgi:hypothetical protein